MLVHENGVSEEEEGPNWTVKANPKSIPKIDENLKDNLRAISQQMLNSRDFHLFSFTASYCRIKESHV